MPITSLDELKRLAAQRVAIAKRIDENNRRIHTQGLTPPEKNRIRAENVRLQFDHDGLKRQTADLNRRIHEQTVDWWRSDDLDDLACLVAALRRAVLQARKDGDLNDRSLAALDASQRFLEELALDGILVAEGVD